MDINISRWTGMILLCVSLCFLTTGCRSLDLSAFYPAEDTITIRGETGSYTEEAASSMEEADVEETDVEETDIEEAVSSSDSRTEEELIYVHVCGCVKHPGLYALPQGERIDAAIRAAGGFTKDADQKSVNLAEILVDGTQIDVLEESSDSVSSSTGRASGEDSRVNINEADQSQLTTLSGIGESRAASIIAYREEHGAFSSIEQIKEVDGIGDGIYQKIKDMIRVSMQNTDDIYG